MGKTRLKTDNVKLNEGWTLEIRPQVGLFAIDFREIWRYRNLCGMFVRRDIVTQYKQTIFGPAWFCIQPILTTVMYMVVFGGIAGLSTDGLPKPLFYLSGICLWQYFSDCLSQTSHTFRGHARLFGKVYFPRLLMPVSYVLSRLVRLCIQMLVFFAVYIYYLYYKNATVSPNFHALLVPVFIAVLAMLSLGFGMIFSSITAKYRDLASLLSFFSRLWMYATPVVYPLSAIKNPKLQMVMLVNPVTPIMEGCKYGLLGTGSFSWERLAYSASFSVILFAVGIVIFNQAQRRFIDTV